MTQPTKKALDRVLATCLGQEDYGLWAQVPGHPGYFLTEVGGGEWCQVWHGDDKSAHRVGPIQPCELAMEEGMPALTKLCVRHGLAECPWRAVIESSD